MAEDLGEKTEKPSARRLGDARSRGQVPKSPELSATVDLVGALVVVLLLGTWIVQTMAELVRHLLDARSSGHLMSINDSEPVLWWAAKQGAMVLVPFMGLMFVVSYLAQVLQVGWLVTLDPVEPKLDRLNPIAGLKRIASRRNLIKTGLNLVKLTLIGAVAYAIVHRNLDAIVHTASLELLPGMVLIGRIVMDLCIWLLAVMLLISLIDFAYQRWQHEQELRMTKQEVKDELRSMEGDPETKGRRLRLARQMAVQRLQLTVPKADVVITNPTHFSVALQYASDKMAAPTVVAKGADFMAFRIREIATARGIPIVEKPPLARALYAEVHVGRQIAPEFYEAVAEVLAYVYRLENRKVG